MSTLGDTMSTWGDIMSTSGDVQYIRGYHDACGGYHEYIGGCSEHWGFQYKSKAFINLLAHMNHDIQCPELTHIIQGENAST